MKSKKMANGGYASGSVDKSNYGRDMMAQEPASGLTIGEQAAEKANKAKKKDAAQPPVTPASGPTKKMAKGGSVTRGDGCAQRGHTKGRNV